MTQRNDETDFEKLFNPIKKFLMGRDLVIFLMFLVISALMWVLKASNKDYESTIHVPIAYSNIPNGYIIAGDMQQELRITISGPGKNLILYRWKVEKKPFPIDLSVVERGKKAIATQSLLASIQKQASQGINVLRIAPDSIHFLVEKQAEKKVNVKVNVQYDLAQQYTLCNDFSFTPKNITVYGPQKVLDSIKEVQTIETTLSEIKDTAVFNLKLKPIDLVSFSDTTISITFKTERFTEKEMQAPISVKNLPQNRTLKIFPSNITASFKVGLSQYDKIDVSSFSFCVDYKEAEKKGKKIKVYAKDAPKAIFGLKITPETVDYIIEEKSE